MEEISKPVSPNLHTSDLILFCGSIIQLGVVDFSRCAPKGEAWDILKISNATNILPQENEELLRCPPWLRTEQKKKKSYQSMHFAASESLQINVNKGRSKPCQRSCS